jgi:hypothetical protein
VPFEDKLVIMGGGGEPSDVGSDVIPLSNGFCNGISCNGIKHSILEKGYSMAGFIFFTYSAHCISYIEVT